MNKKQEALRRGLRSFIEDTSRELADLEGRPLRPPPDPQAADGDTIVVGDAAADGGGAEFTTPDGAAPGVDRIDSPRHDVPAGAVATPESPAAPARTTAESGTLSTGHPPRASHAPAPPALRTKEPVTEPPQAPPVAQRHTPSVAQRDAPPVAERHTPPEPPPRRHSEVPAAPSHAAPAAPIPAEKPTRRAPAPVRRRPRTAAEIGANGVSPAQAHARKGVCFAYFLNHECWRVADAYCNSALQVCITRECPIYHLHKDALGRRFAKKFKHFW